MHESYIDVTSLHSCSNCEDPGVRHRFVTPKGNILSLGSALGTNANPPHPLLLPVDVEATITPRSLVVWNHFFQFLLCIFICQIL